MKKRILSILMALCLALTLWPAAAFAEEGDAAPAVPTVEAPAGDPEETPEETPEDAPESDPANDPEENPEGDPEGELGNAPALLTAANGDPAAAPTLTGTPLTQELIESKKGNDKTEGIQLLPGDYYLTENVCLVGDDAGAWPLSLSGGDFTLDLNGYVLDLRGANIYAIRDLTLKDSNTGNQSHKFRVEESGLWVWDETNGTKTVTGGVITGGVGATREEGSFGGGVYVYAGKNLTMEGGSIVGCTASFGGGVYMMGGDSTFTMESGHIMGCTAGKKGGGVDVDSNSGSRDTTTKFTMEGGSIEDCTAANGGGVYTQAKTEFTMNGGSIQKCTAIETGGGVYGASTFTMNGGSIRNCTAANGGGVYVGGADTSTMTNGSIVGCTAARGGGVFVGDAAFTMEDSSIQNCTATQAGGGVFVVNEESSRFTMNNGSRIENCAAGGVPNAVHADGTFDDHTGIDKSLLSGINGGQTGQANDPILIGSAEGLEDFRDKVNGGKTALCARLLCDIVLNDGTFDKDGNYTPSESVGIAKEWTPIGTDTKPYSGTFDGNGHTIKGLYVKDVPSAGLFGYTAGAAIRNIAVTGYVSGTTSGGIVGTAQGGTAIQNCANTGYVNGTTSGGIVGSAANSTVSSCLNTGAVTGTANAGGIAGRNNGGSIASSFYLTGTAANAVGENTGGTVNNAEAKTKTQFANELLPLLQNGDNNSPWTEYGYNQSLNMTLPLLKGQTADAHTHDYEWKYNDTQHWQECACGVIKAGSEAAHSGGKATSSAKAKCEYCGAEYGELAGGGYYYYTPAADAKKPSPKTADESSMALWCALLALSGGAAVSAVALRRRRAR